MLRVPNRDTGLVHSPEVGSDPFDRSVFRIDHELDNQLLNERSRSEGEVEVAEGADARCGLDQKIRCQGVEELLAVLADHNRPRQRGGSGLGVEFIAIAHPLLLHGSLDKPPA